MSSVYIYIIIMRLIIIINNDVIVMRLISFNYLPDLTFLAGLWIHLASFLALEGFGELQEVGEGSPDPVVGRGVGPQENTHLEVARPMLSTPHVGSTDPEELAGGEVEAG